MHHFRPSLLVIAIVLGTSASCALQGEELGSIEQATACPITMCGANVHVGKAFSLNILGGPNHSGIWMRNAYSANREPIQITAHDNGLAGYLVSDGTPLLGADLEGAMIELVDLAGNEIMVFVSEFHADNVESWVFENEFYPTYYFTWRWGTDAHDVRNPLCAASPWNDMDMDEPDTLNAVILPREAYDWEGKPTNDLGNNQWDGDDWLMIACSGGALAKKKLMGYDMDFNGDRDTSRAENQAAVAMLNARYCGGDSYTTEGVPLWWQNDREWFEDPSGMNVEAIWDTSGSAVCLNDPRYVDRSQVEADCGDVLPYCDGFDPANYAWTSYHP